MDGGVFKPSPVPAGSIVSFWDFKFSARNLRALNLCAISRPSLRREDVPRFFLRADLSPSPRMSDSAATYNDSVL